MTRGRTKWNPQHCLRRCRWIGVACINHQQFSPTNSKTGQPHRPKKTIKTTTTTATPTTATPVTTVSPAEPAGPPLAHQRKILRTSSAATGQWRHSGKLQTSAAATTMRTTPTTTTSPTAAATTPLTPLLQHHRRQHCPERGY
jgi:hypothetical protein